MTPFFLGCFRWLGWWGPRDGLPPVLLQTLLPLLSGWRDWCFVFILSIWNSEGSIFPFGRRVLDVRRDDGPVCGVNRHRLTHFWSAVGSETASVILKTYLLTPCSRVLLQKPTGFQLVKKFPAFYGTRRFITAFTSARHLSLS